MRKLSICRRVTLWFTLFVVAVAAVAIVTLLTVSRRVAQNYYLETLNSTVSLAKDEIAYSGGEVQIDRNLDELPNVNVAIYDAAGELIYGKTRFDTEFISGEHRKITDRTGSVWHVLDTVMTPSGGPELWLRLYISAGVSEALSASSLFWALVLIPALAVMAALGGYAITRAALRPVVLITRTAEGIVDGRDLKKRVALPDAKDEIYNLAAVIDLMLERLEASFERERRFTSDAAHELRTPIAAILAQSQSVSETDDMKSALKDISEKAAFMSGMVGRLLALTRMESGRSPLNMESVDIGDICEAVAELYDGQASVAREGNLSLICDQSLITRAVMNLAENAARYGGGIIDISAREHADGVEIEVRDYGAGIPESEMPRIFDRFFQGASAKSGEGAGLGLSMVSQIARLHGGEIAVRNDGGAVFTLTLPRSLGADK